MKPQQPPPVLKIQVEMVLIPAEGVSSVQQYFGSPSV